MLNLPSIEPVDYLVIGHLTQDVTPLGPRLGGTAAYASLTARALGMRVGVVTACSPDLDLGILDGIQVAALSSEETTTFENVQTPQGRVQYLYALAPNLDYPQVPEAWRSAPVVHLGPVAQEVEPGLLREFPTALIGLTPQGWLRTWDKDGRVRLGEWPEARFVLERSGAAVLSVEDVAGDEARIEEMASSIRVLVVTEGVQGARVYWNGDLRRFRPPHVSEVDPVGAGDVFAAAFFIRLYATRDPWEAARFANHLAAISVTRPGLSGIPTPDEVETAMIEVVRRP